MTVKFTMLGVRFLDVDFMRINLACASHTVRVKRLFCTVVKGRSGCMERIAIAMQDGGTGAGAQHGGAGREANLIFVLPPNIYAGPPGAGRAPRGGGRRGLFWFQIFIQASSPETWRKTIFGGEEVLAGKWVACFWASSLGKNFWRRDRDHLVPPREDGCSRSAVPRSAILSDGSTGGIRL